VFEKYQGMDVGVITEWLDMRKRIVSISKNGNT
jgi:hypothetical protein